MISLACSFCKPMSSFKQTVSYCNQNTDIFIAYIFTGVSVFAGGPEFIGNLQNVTVPEGRDATFTCSVTNLGGHKVDNFKKSISIGIYFSDIILISFIQVAWIKSDTKAILAIHYHVITNNENLQVKYTIYGLSLKIIVIYPQKCFNTKIILKKPNLF